MDISKKQKKEEVKYSIIYASALLILFSIIVLFIHSIIHESNHKKFDKEQEEELWRMEDEINDIFTRVESSLIYITEVASIKEIFTHETPKLRTDSESLFSAIIKTNTNKFSPTFSQVRLVALNGREILRVDLIDKEPIITDKTDLQDKSDRYYIKEALLIDKTQIYMSPLDLNIEHGKIEKPYKPMIRFALPIFCNTGEKVGLLIINYLAQQLLSNLDNMAKASENKWFLINSDGYYLHSTNQEEEFGFMFPEKKNNTAMNLDPELWDAIKSKTKTVHLTKGHYHIASIRPFYQDKMFTVPSPKNWTLVILSSEEIIDKQDNSLNLGLFIGFITMAPLLFILGWAIGKSKVKNRWYFKALKESSILDSMTTLYNHRFVMQKLEYLMNQSERTDSPLSLAYIDIDNLKQVNDSLGHKKGDEIILACAEAIKESIRNTDIPARVGGDEFIIILSGSSKDESQLVLERIETKYSLYGKEIIKSKASLSWGIANWRGSSDTMEELISRADRTMYKMKKESKEIT